MNRFFDIGFPVANMGDFIELVQNVERSGPMVWKLPDNLGSYARAIDEGSGAEVWVYLNKDNGVYGLSPHYHGKTKLRGKVIEKIPSKEYELEGLVVCQTNRGDKKGTLDTIIFNSPNLLLNETEAEQEYILQLAAFPHVVSCFSSAEEFAKSHDDGHGPAPKSFITAGIVEKDQPTESTAMICGIVKKIDNKINDYSSEVR